LYEGILLDIKFAGFLLARLLGRNVFLEELKELDEEVWKNLIFVKHYEGTVVVL
jgi:ubiquitin-protein ligase E3 B